MSTSEESATSDSSIYTRIGGRAAVRGTVTALYDRILTDKRINAFFKEADVRRLRRKLVRR